MKHAPILLAAALAALASCKAPEPEPLSGDVLADVRRLIDAGDYSGARDLLNDHERSEFDRQSQGTYSLLGGELDYQRGDFREAIRQYEWFLRFQGAASDSRVAEERLLEMGLALLNGEKLSLGIFTNKRRGEITLQNLAAWAPNSPSAAEALARLGEYHFENHDFDEAEQDYSQILRFHGNSEWADLATFRLGMAGFYRIKGPLVDGQMIRGSLDQLKRYLGDYPSGLYREEAGNTVARLEELLAAHDLAIGDYYEVIDNVRGARYHYRLASQRSGTDAGRDAREALGDLPPDPPLEEPQSDAE